MAEAIDRRRRRLIQGTEQNDSTSLSRAKSIWETEFGTLFPETKIVLAPHTLRLAQCCSMAVSRNCVLIGGAANEKPKNLLAHKILKLDMSDDTERVKLVTLIKRLLNDLKCRKTYSFYIAYPFGVDGKISYSTVLAAVWKFVAQYQPELDLEDVGIKKIKETLKKFFKNEENNPVVESEIAAVINSSIFKAYIDDSEPDNGELVAVDTENFFHQFDILYIETNLGGANLEMDKFFYDELRNAIRVGFENVLPIGANENGPFVNDELSIGKVLSGYSLTRITGYNSNASNYERQLQKVLEVVDESPSVYGGYVLPKGLVLMIKNGEYNNDELRMLITEVFITNFDQRPEHIIIELLRDSAPARVVGPADEALLSESKLNIHVANPDNISSSDSDSGAEAEAGMDVDDEDNDDDDEIGLGGQNLDNADVNMH